MTQQAYEQQDTRCLLCLTPVRHQGDVCSRCEPRYLALGKALIVYANQLEPLLKASSHTHIGALMRFVPEVHFSLQALDAPISYNEQMPTYRLTAISPKSDGSLQWDSWYGHTIPSTFMAATINRDFMKMGFPEEPEYFVPISSWKPVAYPDTKPMSNEAAGGTSDGQH